MRRYDIVFGILLILSIIDFALAVPVLVQEKRQADVDVVHIPKDTITVLGKRVGEDLAKLTEEVLKSGDKPEVSAGVHASSSSAPPEPGYGSTNVAQAPERNPASSTTNSDPSIEPSSSASESTTSEVPLPLSPELMDESGSKYWSSTSLGYLLPKPEPPKEEPLTQFLTGPSRAKYWTNKYWTGMSSGDLLPKPEPPNGVGKGHEPQDEKQPNAGPRPSDPGPSSAKPSNSQPTTLTILDSSTGLRVYSLPPLPPGTIPERATMGYRPPPPPADPDLRLSLSLTPTGVYRYPGSTVHTPSPELPTIPEHEVRPPPPPPKGPEDGMVHERPSTPGSPTDPKN